MRIKCPNCQHRLKAKLTQFDKGYKCTNCGKIIHTKSSKLYSWLDTLLGASAPILYIPCLVITAPFFPDNSDGEGYILILSWLISSAILGLIIIVIIDYIIRGVLMRKSIKFVAKNEDKMPKL